MIDARVLSAVPVADFVNSILHNTSDGSTTLVICSTREKFLEQLAAGITTARSHAHTSSNNNDDDEHPEQDEQSQLLGAGAVGPAPPLGHLLSNTLGTLANSRGVKLVFCSSLAQLRAYLATFGLRTARKNISIRDVCGNTTIAILDLIAMHYLSTEFSAQGLSRTLALAVETAARTGSAITLCECSDMVNVGNPDRGLRLWDLQVPLLNGGTILVGNAATPSGQSGRHVSVRRVAQRWFRFEEVLL